MTWSVLVFLAGLVLLYYGAEWLIEAAAHMALDFGLRPLVVGLTIVALGTSLPEFFTNVLAAFSREPDLALGNIIGSNICNIALILGASALVAPLRVERQMLGKEYPLMMGAMLLFFVLSLDGLISRWDGGLMVLSLLGVMVFLFIDAKRDRAATIADPPDASEDPPAVSRRRMTFYLVVGIGMLIGGAHLMVRSAIHIADAIGIDHIVIGLTVVAIGTSLPELAASMVGALKQEADLSVGNVLGSNLLNVLFVVGVVALMSPLTVHAQSLTLHFPVMLAFGALMLPLAWTQYRINRWEGALLVSGFAGYMTYLVLPYVS